MLTAGIAVLTGVILACFEPQRVDIYWISYLPLCLFLAAVQGRLRFGWLAVAAFLYTMLHIHLQLQQRLPQTSPQKILTLSGEIDSIPSWRGSRAIFLLHPLEGDDARDVPKRIRISWRDAPSVLDAGQVWRVKLKIRRPHGYRNPGAFDYERWLFSHAIHATGYVVEAQSAQRLDDVAWSIDRWRARINIWIESHCAECGRLGFILALSTGYRDKLDEADKRLLRQTGTAHLVAISGLHIGIIAGFAFVLAGSIWKLLPRSHGSRADIAWAVAWSAALVYSLLSGFALPAQRAFIMLSVLALLHWTRLPANPLHSLAITLVVIAVVSPLALLTTSFWLTFCALGVILLALFLLRGEQRRWRQLAVIQLLFSLLFIPLTMLVFDEVHPASFVANLLVVPLVSLVVVPGAFLLLALAWLPANWIELGYWLLDKLAEALMAYLQFIQDAGLEAIDFAPNSYWQPAMILLLWVLLLLPRPMLPMRVWLLLLPGILLWSRDNTNQVPLQVTVLDVGMGNAVVVQTRDHSLIYDFGPGNRNGFSLGRWAVEPYLREQGIDEVDRIVISHADQDHAGGLHALSDEFSRVPVLSGTPSELRQQFAQLRFIYDCHRAAPWRWDGIEFRFLPLSSEMPNDDNNRSCVLRISIGDENLLLSGDIEASREQELLEHEPASLRAGILLAPHHGSRSSSSIAFIDAVRPQHVIFSVGHLNRWSFPHREVIERYQSAAAQIHRTDRDGAIQINCDQDGCKVEKFRQRYPRIWY